MAELSPADPSWSLALALALGLLVSPAVVFALRSIHLLWMLALARLGPVLPTLLAPAVTTHRVGFLDCDPNLHITNSRYLALVDRGRFQLLFRLRFGRLMRNLGYRMLMGTSCIRYRRSIDLFQRYHMHNRILGWDDKWVFVEHRFEVGGRTAVMVLAKFVITCRREIVPPDLAMARLELARLGSPELDVGEPLPSPELPERVKKLLQDSDILMSPD